MFSGCPLSPLPSLPYPLLLPSAFLPCSEAATENQLADLGGAVSCPSGVRGEGPTSTTTNAFWCILSSKIAPDGSIFYKRPKKKQLYRQEGPERRSKSTGTFRLDISNVTAPRTRQKRGHDTVNIAGCRGME